MTAVALGEVVECLDRLRVPVKESERVPGPVPYYGANGRQGWIDRAIFDEPLVVVAEDGGHFGAPERGVAYRISGPSWVNNHGHVLRASSKVDHDYLFHALRNFNFAPYISGSTRSKLTQKQLMQAEIPLPTLDEQRRIAAILDHADAIRAKHRQVLAHLDTLTQSIFHDMFGDITDPRWGRVALSEVVGRIDNGTSPNCESRPATPDEWGVLKLGAVTYGIFQQEENKAYLDDVGKMTVNEVRQGDVLMTRKNTRELVGAVALVDNVRPRLLLPDLIFRLDLDKSQIDRRYFHALMMNPRKRSTVRDLSSGSAASMPNISKARLSRLLLEIPPLELQIEFARRATAVNSRRAAVQRTLSADDELFASLQSRAFRGEL